MAFRRMVVVLVLILVCHGLPVNEQPKTNTEPTSNEVSGDSNSSSSSSSSKQNNEQQQQTNTNNEAATNQIAKGSSSIVQKEKPKKQCDCTKYYSGFSKKSCDESDANDCCHLCNYMPDVIGEFTCKRSSSFTVNFRKFPEYHCSQTLGGDLAK